MEYKTARLILRELEETDWKVIIELRSDKLINRYIDRKSICSKHDSINFIKEKKTNKSEVYFAIQTRDNKETIGTICLWNHKILDRTAEIGYDMLTEFQGNGFMLEAVKKVLQIGFEKNKLNQIIGNVHLENKRSVKLLKSAGFSNETLVYINTVKHMRFTIDRSYLISSDI